MTVEGVGLRAERSAGCGITPRCLQRRSEPPTNQAHTSQSSSGLGFQVTVLETFQGVLGSGNVFSRRQPRENVLASWTLARQMWRKTVRTILCKTAKAIFCKTAKDIFCKTLKAIFCKTAKAIFCVTVKAIFCKTVKAIFWLWLSCKTVKAICCKTVKVKAIFCKTVHATICVRQSRPYFGLSFHAEVIKPFDSVPPPRFHTQDLQGGVRAEDSPGGLCLGAKMQRFQGFHRLSPES